MKKITVVGHFGVGKTMLNGQTIKTKIITSELSKKLGDENVQIVDTHDWKKNTIHLLKSCVSAVKNSDFIFLLPAHNGVKVFIPLFVMLNYIYKKSIAYIVVGGWLPKMVKEHACIKRMMTKLTKIYVETNTLKNDLNKLGLDNVVVLPNCKNLKKLSEDKVSMNIKYPLKVCTFSRVMKEKGIEDIVSCIKNINEKFGETIYTLDIYGQVDVGYENDFKVLVDSFPEYINYKGEIAFDKSIDVLKDYFVLAFPTKFYTEGIPGTIIDAYSAALPVVSSKWESFDDLIEDGVTGIGYSFDDVDELNMIMEEFSRNPERVNKMKYSCLKKAECFSSDFVIGNLLRDLNII